MINNKIQYILKDFRYKHEIKTRFKDLDAFNHVNNAVFLSYIEDARTFFLKRWGIDFKRRSLVVAGLKIDYVKQLHHPSKLIIGQKITRIGTKSFDILSVIFQDENAICISIVTLVCFNFNHQKTVKLYHEIKADFNI